MVTQARRDLYSPHTKLTELYPETQYNPETGQVTIGDYNFAKGQIPGTMFDPQGYHHVYDQNALLQAMSQGTQQEGTQQESWRAPGESPPPIAPGQSIPTLPSGQQMADLSPQIQSQVMDYLQRHGQSQHQEQMQSLIGDMPKWEQQTEAERLAAAKRDAGLQIDPHLAAIQRALESNQQALDAQRDYAIAGHAGYQTDMDYAIDESMKHAMEASIARGGGRGGLANWMEVEMLKPIMGEAQRVAAMHEAKLNDIASQKTLAQQQYNEHMVQLEQRRGELEAHLMQVYAERDHAMARQDWELAFNANMQLEQMQEQKHQFDTQMAHAHAQFQESQRQFDDQMRQAQAQFTESQRQFDGQMALAHAQFAEAQRQSDNQMGLAYAQFGEEQRQFDTRMDFDEAKWFQDQENINKDRVLEEAVIFGAMGGGTAGGGGMPARQYVESHGGTIDWQRASDGGDIVIINGKPIHVQAAGGSNEGGSVHLPERELYSALFY